MFAATSQAGSASAGGRRRLIWGILGWLLGFALAGLAALALGFAALAAATWWAAIEPFAKHPVVKLAPERSLALAAACGFGASGLFVAAVWLVTCRLAPGKRRADRAALPGPLGVREGGRVSQGRRSGW